MAFGDARTKAFKATLIIDGLGLAEWAEAHNVSYVHVLKVMGDDRSSRHLEKVIDSYIAATLVPFCRAFLTKADERNATAA